MIIKSGDRVVMVYNGTRGAVVATGRIYIHIKRNFLDRVSFVSNCQIFDGCGKIDNAYRYSYDLQECGNRINSININGQKAIEFSSARCDYKIISYE